MNTTLQQVKQAIRAKMDAEQFWPNVWNVSDHGNWSIVTV